MGVHDFQGVVTFVTVAHHAKSVSHPQSSEVNCTVSADPHPVAGQVVVTEHVKVLNHPFEAFSIVIVPGAVAATLLRPQIDHLSGEVGWVGYNGGDCEGSSHENSFHVLIAEVLIQPHKEVLILVERVEGAVCGPEQELVHGQRETTTEQVGGSLLEWDAEEGLGW